MSNSSQYQYHLNQQQQQQHSLSHKISKPRKFRQKNNNVVITHTTSTNANQHPPIYFIDKTGFKQLVQNLTGFNSSAVPTPNPPKERERKRSSKLEVNRPPPLSEIRPNLLPASPVSPLPVLQEEPDSPITAYMKYLGEHMVVGDAPVPDNNANPSDQQSLQLQLQEGSKDAIDANNPMIVSGPELPVQSDFVSSDGMQFRVEDMSFVDHVSAYAPEAIAYHNYPDEQNGFFLEPFLGNNDIGIFDSSSSSTLAVGQEKIQTQEEELKSLEEMPGSSFRDAV